MNYLNFRKKRYILYILLIFITSCNYKPLLTKDQLDKFKFGNIEIEGDKRIVQLVVNNLSASRDKSGKLDLYINGKKKIYPSNKSSSGKILEYSINLNYEVKIKNNLSGKIIYSKMISNSEKYKSSDNYSETINREKKIIDNISNLVAKQIINELNIVLRNDI